MAESLALHFSGRAAARLDEPPLVNSTTELYHRPSYIAAPGELYH